MGHALSTDLDRIENELKIKLPSYYRSYIENYPLQASKNKIGLNENEEGMEDLYLYTDTSMIIKDNLYMRNTDWSDFNFVWNDTYFQIGKDGTGGYYFIDINSELQNIFFFHISDNEMILEFESLDLFIDDCIEVFQESIY